MSDRRAMNERPSLKWLAWSHIGLGAVILLFWAGFHSEIIFPKALLAPRIANFEGYYGWESAFTLPDSFLAVVMIGGGLRLLRTPRDPSGSTLLLAASGACIFLGVLDFAYDSSHGMYNLGHFFSLALLAIAVMMPPFGLYSIYRLYHALFKTGD